MGLDLKKFRALLGVTQASIALETDLTQATISRIENRVEAPRGISLLSIQRWADEAAVRRDIPASQRLDWRWVLNR